MVKAHARFDEDTDWDLISIKMAKDMGMDIMPVPASVGWTLTDWENKEGGKVKAVGLGVGSIISLGTDWKSVDWAVCSGMDTPILLKKETWSFLMEQ